MNRMAVSWFLTGLDGLIWTDFDLPPPAPRYDGVLGVSTNLADGAHSPHVALVA